MIAVHFGAGNIGRGFIGCLLNQAGYELVFLDVNESVVDLLNSTKSYRVLETGSGAKTHLVSSYSALNSQTQFEEAANAIASAQVLTTSVGVSILKFLAPLIDAGLARRTIPEPLVIMACENAIGASDVLKEALIASGSTSLSKALFANTAVDRIVPPQVSHNDLDVTVEAFSEWVIDSSSLGDLTPNIPGAIFVKDLSPYIERKLFTVNTGHATLAYLGQRAGLKTIVEAAQAPEIAKALLETLGETGQVLSARHHVDAAEHSKYVAKTIERFSNPELDDPVERVGRQPRRKLSRHDRLVGPAAYLAELGVKPVSLLQVIEAALLFEDETDPDVAALREQLINSNEQDFVSDVMGIDTQHSLAAELTRHVLNVKTKLRS